LYHHQRFSVISTGIGADNMDIVINELDALVNIDMVARLEKKRKKTLRLIRIGTTGGLQPDLPPGSFLLSEKSVSFDGLLFFYAQNETVRDLDFETAFCRQTNWPADFNRPYVTTADPTLTEQLAQSDIIRGVTWTANGFYGPQGRTLRLPLADPALNDRLSAFSLGSYRLTNYEMESGALTGLSALLGHQAVTICLVIANRFSHQVEIDYHSSMTRLIKTVLDRL
jgi:uridine phosphorylase